MAKKDKRLSLSEFCHKRRLELVSFEAAYNMEAARNPQQYPYYMELGQEWLWDEFLDTFQQTGEV